MRIILLYISLTLSYFFALPHERLSAQTMLIDEDFSDWSGAQLIHTDNLNDGAIGELDFHQLWMSDDTENIYIRIDLGKEIEIQEFDELFIYIDLDDNANTGFTDIGFPGADFMYGFGVRGGILKLGSINYSIFHNDIQLVSLPTVSSSEFEISISKTIDYFQGVYQINSPNIRISFTDEHPSGDKIPDLNGISFPLSNAEYTPPLHEIDNQLSDDIRFLSYNVLSDGLFDPGRQAAFSRIIRAISPQIICFQEVYDHSSLEVAQLMEVLLPSAQNEQWYQSKINPDIILVGRYPIITSASTDGNGIFEVQTPDKKIIIVGAHFPCCNNDAERQLEIDRLMGFLRNSIDGLTNIDIPANTPIFVLGDMNLVGFQQQQHTLLTGDINSEQLFGPDFNPDWDGSSFDDALPFATGRPHAVTWYNPSGSFSAGRLDYLLYTGAVVALTQSFALNTADLTTQQLIESNLLPSDVQNASDHFPCVMDVNLSPNVSTEYTESTSVNFEIRPNPVTHDLYILHSDLNESLLEAEIFTMSGKSVYSGYFLPEGEVFKINIENLVSGSYLLHLHSGDGMIGVAKFIKL